MADRVGEAAPPCPIVLVPTICDGGPAGDGVTGVRSRVRQKTMAAGTRTNAAKINKTRNMVAPDASAREGQYANRPGAIQGQALPGRSFHGMVAMNRLVSSV